MYNRILCHIKAIAVIHFEEGFIIDPNEWPSGCSEHFVINYRFHVSRYFLVGGVWGPMGFSLC